MNYKKKANITLALVAVGFILTSILMCYNKENQLLRMLFYILEAALIGGGCGKQLGGGGMVREWWVRVADAGRPACGGIPVVNPAGVVGFVVVGVRCVWGSVCLAEWSSRSWDVYRSLPRSVSALLSGCVW